MGSYNLLKLRGTSKILTPIRIHNVLISQNGKIMSLHSLIPNHSFHIALSSLIFVREGEKPDSRLNTWRRDVWSTHALKKFAQHTLSSCTTFLDFAALRCFCSLSVYLGPASCSIFPSSDRFTLEFFSDLPPQQKKFSRHGLDRKDKSVARYGQGGKK